MKGTILYTLIYSIGKDVMRATDEIIKPVRSSPNYEEYFPKFKVLENAVVQEIKGRKIIFDLKTFNATNLIVEAETTFNLKDTGSLLELKNTLFEECRKLAKEYAPSVFFEEYIFFLVSDYDKDIDAYVKRNSHQIAGVLKDEPLALVEKEVSDTIGNHIKYGQRDIAIIDWDGAFLIDGKGEFKDMIAVLELANIQLLNLRILDNKLQDQIAALKKQIEPGDLSSFFKLGPYMKEIIKIRTQSALELENIDNSIKLYGDWYSGKLYDLAGKKFYLEKWKGTVEKKLNVLKDLFEMVTHIMTERYNLILEFSIAVMIIFEIIIAFLPLR